MTEDVVNQGREAWARIRRRGQTTFDDWIAVGKAIAVGRAECLKASNTNRPYGKVYIGHMTAWLAVTGLHEIASQERYWALQIVDNLAAIARWRDGLDDAKRRRFNHPQAIWVNWRGSTSPKKPSAHVVRHCLPKGREGTGRPIFFPQDMLRRGALAMKEAHTNDLFALTRACLEAAIRSDLDLLGLLPDVPARKAAPVPAFA